MRWWKRRTPDQDPGPSADLMEARLAEQRAAGNAESATRVSAESAELAGRLRDLRDRDEFADLVKDALTTPANGR